MDSECQDLLFGDLFTKNGTTMEELLAYVHPILQEDSNEMNPIGTAVGGVSFARAETDTLLDNHPELCQASCTTVRNESSEFVTKNRLRLMVSSQQASHTERNSSARRMGSVAKRKRAKTRNNVVSDGGTRVVKRRYRWSNDEHARFLQGLLKYGKSNWKDIANKEVRTRTPLQVASHAQKHFLRQLQINKMRSSINDFSVKLIPSKCLPDMPESSSAAVQRHSGRHAINIPDPRYGTVRVPPEMMQASPAPFRHNFNMMQSPLSSLEQRHSGRSADNIPDPRYGTVRVPPALAQPSSVPVRHNFNVIASRYVPAQRNSANVIEGERNFGGPIQPRHLEEQYYLPVTMQLPAPPHLPAQWNPNHFPCVGNFWPVRSSSMELHPVTTQMFPGKFDHLPLPPL